MTVSWERRNDLKSRPLQLLAEVGTVTTGVLVDANFDGVVDWDEFMAAVQVVNSHLLKQVEETTVE